MAAGAARATFLWGLRRSGTHLVAGWLYANHGGVAKDPLPTDDRHPQLCDGFSDPSASVAFFNNCGRAHARDLELGALTAPDFTAAAAGRRATLFSIEDCALRFADRMPSGGDVARVLVVRDPLNNVASRLRGADALPGLVRVDEGYLDLLAEYCAELLGRTDHLGGATVISFNRFVVDRSYRDGIAAALGVPNRDATSEVSTYGGGSSFDGLDGPRSPEVLLARHRQHPLPRSLVDALLARPVIADACEAVFGYDLATEATRP